MNLKKRKLFKQLEDQQKSRVVVVNPIQSLFPEVPSIYPRHTLGYLADQLRRQPDALIEQFENAGIPGLTPHHRITEDHKEALLAYLKASHRVESQELYRDRRSNDDQIVVVKEITSEILAQLARRPEFLHHLDPRRFEELVARLLEDQGCEVTLTKRTRDGGYDIFGRTKAGPSSLIFLAECKRYSPENKVGVEVVRSLYGVTEAHRANLGLVITTSSFTKDATNEKLRIGARIDLKDFCDLRSWLAPYNISR